jgi:hypothetical protein
MEAQVYAGCRCGQVKFSARSEPLIQLVCHCSHCQSASGKDFVEIVFYKLKHTSIVGDVNRRDFVADSGKHTQRQFCSRCNDFMFDQSEGFPGIIGVLHERMLDFVFAPKCHIWVKSKREGVEIPANILQFQQNLQLQERQT